MAYKIIFVFFNILLNPNLGFFDCLRECCCCDKNKPIITNDIDNNNEIENNENKNDEDNADKTGGDNSDIKLFENSE